MDSHQRTRQEKKRNTQIEEQSKEKKRSLVVSFSLAWIIVEEVGKSALFYGPSRGNKWGENSYLQHG